MKKISFIIANDTIFHSLNKIIEQLNVVAIVEVWSQFGVNEGAEETIMLHYPSLYKGKISIIDAFFIETDAIVLCNDWSTEAKSIIKIFRSRGIPSVCLQESVVGFNDIAKRLEHSDFVLTQDMSSSKLITAPKIIPVGNPRYENYQAKELPSEQKIALINCNFTYGIYEEERLGWIRGCVEEALACGYSPKISKHPRDNGDLEQFDEYIIRSSVSSIENQIEEASVILTRFSSLIHESILKGRPVIYYNPHEENFNYDFGNEFPILHYVSNQTELKACLVAISNKSSETILREAKKYVDENLLIREKKPSTLITEFLRDTDLKVQRHMLPKWKLMDKDFFLTCARYLKLALARWKFVSASNKRQP
jgi:hypothetical protein